MLHSLRKFSIPLVNRRNQLILHMKLNCGIVGLPNVGKSTLFNALVGSEQAQAANFPFCTIEPNVGLVHVPDDRLNKLAEISRSVKITPAAMEIVDIAGIVKGASEGLGLGNKFLANIRQTDTIVHVVRCFVNDDVIHVDTTVDPVRDAEVISLELIFADVAQVEKRRDRVAKERKPDELALLTRLLEWLNEGKPARLMEMKKEEKELLKPLMLLTMKPVIYACNVADADLASGNEMSKSIEELAAKEGSKAVLVSAQVESELSTLGEEERVAFLSELGVTDDSKSGLKCLIPIAFDTLGLQTYFTTGPEETRAWTIRKGMSAPQAAGVIHTDFESGFIRAETIAYDDLIRLGSEKACKEQGLMRAEGKEYIVKDGDCMLFRFNR